MRRCFASIRFLFVVLSALPLPISIAQVSPSDSPDGMWMDLSAVDLETLPAKNVNPESVVRPTTYRPLWLDETLLDDLLGFAPMEDVRDRDRFAKSAVTIWLPMPDGTNIEFAFVESPIMEPGLAEKFPEIKTYAGRSLDGKDLFVRFDRTQKGLHAIVLGGRAIYIDPYAKEGVYISYFADDYPRNTNAVGCQFSDAELIDEAKGGGGLSQHGDKFRTYRLAVACSGEYAIFHDATSQQTLGNAMAAITTTVNRVTGIFESELAVGFTLVANNDLILFWDPATDPFNPTGTVKEMMNASQTTINAVIGAVNYDIGHTFAVALFGGIGDFGSVCDPNRKAKGVSTDDSPEGDPFDVDFVAHEIGHQFKAEHTFNSTSGGCKGNRAKDHAYERGAGTTIMSYAGICGGDNVTEHAAANFHSESLAQIQDFLPDAACAVTAFTGDSGPLVDAGADYTIPKQTPFKLTATGTDSDGDLITYSWEERDLGPAQKIQDPDNGKSPLFRALYPKTEPYRYFPALSKILEGQQSGDEFERLPSLARTMTFWVVGRDAHGGFGSNEAQLTVNATSGPFKVTYPNTQVIIKGGSKKKVKWNVANTSLSPVNATNVRILLSYDGGQSFPKVLKSSTPNDGEEKVKFPNTSTLLGRVKVEAVDNIFFDISDKNFAIDAGFSLVGTWIEISYIFSEPFTRLVFAEDTVTRCYAPAYTSCQVTNSPYTFENFDDPVYTKKLSIPAVPIPDNVWYCKIIDNNTIETYYRTGLNQFSRIGTLQRQ